MKKIVITGSSGGIGSALVEAFNESGWFVIGLDNKPGKQELNAFVQVDLNHMVTDAALRHKKIQEIKQHCDGDLHALVNNAAVQILGHVGAIPLEDWQTTMNVNLTAPFLLTQELLVELTNVQGVVINMGSIHQQLTKSNFVSYATSKSALVGLTKSMAVDLKGKIRVNSISPAAVKTDMLLAGFGGKDSALKELETLHPVGRIGDTKDIARLVMFLCNENEGFIHGANFTIDGGISSVLSDL